MLSLFFAFRKQSHSTTVTENTLSIGSDKIYILFMLLCSVVIGFRAETVGIDTWNYFCTFNSRAIRGVSDITDLSWFQEPGYKALIYLCNNLGIGWNIYALLYALVFCCPILYLAFTTSRNPYLSVFFFIVLGYFFFPMSTMRQAFAIGMCVLAYISMNSGTKRSILFGAIFILLAVGFHVSAVVFGAFLLVSKLPLRRGNWIIWIVGALLVAILLKGAAQSFLSGFFMMLGRDEYQEIENTGGMFRELFFLFSIACCFFVSKHSEDFMKNNSNYIKAIIISSVLLPIFNFHPALARMYMYFAIFEIILIVNIIDEIRNGFKPIVAVFYMTIGLYMMSKIVLSPQRQLLPYLFFWQ